MTKTPLTEIQQTLLSAAVARKSGTLLPFPKDLDAPSCKRSVAALLRRGLAAEVEVAARKPAWREADGLRFGLAITDAGRAALEVEVVEEVAAPPLASAVSKIGQVVALLSKPTGASIAELMGATGWLPHTTRAALTGLRKKGHSIVRESGADETRYHIAAA